MHIVNRLAVDNSDEFAPKQPELSHFLRVSQNEEAVELEKAKALGYRLEAINYQN